MERIPITDGRARPRAGAVPATLEARTKLVFFAGAGISFVASIALWFSGQREEGLFVGLWVPSVLAAGILLLAGGGGHHD